MPEQNMNYQPQVGNTARGPQEHVYVPHFDNPFGRSSRPYGPGIGENNNASSPSSTYTYSYPLLRSGLPPQPPRPEYYQPTYFYNQHCHHPFGTNVNINVTGGCTTSNCAQCIYPYANFQYGGYPMVASVPVQAANGQWMQSPYNRMGAGYGPYGGAALGGPTGNVWPGPTRSQNMANIMARADRRPQGMAPSDLDPWRFYEVKELDGGVTTRNRFTIDSGEIGKVVWYQRADASFYAVVVEKPEEK